MNIHAWEHYNEAKKSYKGSNNKSKEQLTGS
jgi:hypothetical protein